MSRLYILLVLCLTLFTIHLHAHTQDHEQTNEDMQLLMDTVKAHHHQDMVAKTTTTLMETGTETETETDADAEVDAETETEAETDAETDADEELDADIDAETETETETEIDTDSELDAAFMELSTDIDSDASTTATAIADADIHADAETETEIDTELDALTTVDADVDMDAEIDANIAVDENVLLEMETEGEAEAETETEEGEEMDEQENALLETEMNAEQTADLDSNDQLLADAEFEKKSKHSKAALRYLRALSESGTLRSARRLDRSLRQHGFLARFKNPETQVCHGTLSNFKSAMPPRTFYGYEEKYCEALTAQQYIDRKNVQGILPQIKHFRTPHKRLFIYTENKINLFNGLQLINQKQGWTNNWNIAMGNTSFKSDAVRQLNAFCDFQQKFKHYPNKYAGYIERIPIDKNWILGMAVTGVSLQSPSTPITMKSLVTYLKSIQELTTTMTTRESTKFKKWLELVEISPIAADVLDQFAHVPNYVITYTVEIGTCDSLGISFEDRNMTSWTTSTFPTIFSKVFSGLLSIGRRQAHLEPYVMDYLSYHLYHRQLSRAGTLSPFVVARRNIIRRGFNKLGDKLTRKKNLAARKEKRANQQYNRTIKLIRKRNLKLLRKVGRSIKRSKLTKEMKLKLRDVLKLLIVNVKKGFQLNVADIMTVRKSARRLYRQFLGIITGIPPKPRPTKKPTAKPTVVVTTTAPTTKTTTTTTTTTTAAPTTATTTAAPTSTPTSAATNAPTAAATSAPTVPVTAAPTVPATSAPTFPTRDTTPSTSSPTVIFTPAGPTVPVPSDPATVTPTGPVITFTPVGPTVPVPPVITFTPVDPAAPTVPVPRIPVDPVTKETTDAPQRTAGIDVNVYKL